MPRSVFCTAGKYFFLTFISVDNIGDTSDLTWPLFKFGMCIDMGKGSEPIVFVGSASLHEISGDLLKTKF